MKKLLLLACSFMSLTTLAGDDWTKKLSEAVSHATFLKNGGSTGPRLMAYVGTNPVFESSSSPEAGLVVAGIGGAGWCLWKGWEYLKSVDPKKVKDNLVMGYEAVNMLSELKKKLYDAAEVVEEEENRLRVEQAAAQSSSSSSSNSSSSSSSSSSSTFIPHISISNNNLYSPSSKERMAILYEIKGQNAYANLVFLNCNNDKKE